MYLTKVRLYGQTKIDPARNLRVENIRDYLGGLEMSSHVFEDFKRTYPARELTIRLPISDEESEVSFDSGLAYNYACLTYSNGDSSYDWYYFVTAFHYIADSTLEVSLRLDSINTFPWEGWLSDRTYISRALINRWNADGSAIVDPVSEGVSGEIIKKNEGTFPTTPTYLIYRNDTKGVPAMYAVARGGIPATGRLHVLAEAIDDKISTGNAWGIRYETSSTDVISVEWKSNGQTGHWTADGETSYLLFFDVIQDSATNIKYGQLVLKGSSHSLELGPRFSIGAVNPSSKTDFMVSTQDGAPAYSGSVNSSDVMENPEPVKTQDFADIDRTASDLAKIVEIPYRGNLGQGDFEMRKDGVYLRFTDLDSNSIMATLTMNAGFLSKRKPGPTATKASAMVADPKLSSSEFSYYKLVYDSYSTSFGGENLPEGVYEVTIDFVPSSSISSSLIFKAKPSSGKWRNVKEDYPFLIASDRNNEMPIYSSAWFDYLRNGYNYDKKKLAVSTATSIFSGLGSILASALSIAGGAGLIASGAGIPAGVGMVVGGATGIASAIGGTSTSIWSDAVGQEQKENALKRQASSVQSINDLSLFKSYGNGALKWEYWGPRNEFENSLENLFFYRGYARGVYGVPNMHVRTSFDYFEGTPSWNSEALTNAQKEFLDDLASRLMAGVTILHNYQNEWDFEQAKNNLEV